MILPRYAFFAAFLAAAGVPIYIHAPKFYADNHGVSLGAIGLALFGLRLLDVVQDPLLGRLAGRLDARRGAAAMLAGTGMALGMLGLFAVTPPMAPLAWMAVCLVLLFSCFSFLSILFYARGVGQAETMGAGGHVRLGGWRETGALLGITGFCIAPAGLAALGVVSPYAGFAYGFAVLSLVAGVAMHPLWPGKLVMAGGGFAHLLRDAGTRRLLVIGLVNAAPVAVTSTLFLFFVESRLGAPGLEGPLLVAFFVAAAASAPLWSRLARTLDPETVLAGAMVLAIGSFIGAYGLGTGDWAAFLVICLLSGVALGADMTILPALLSQRIAEIGGNGGEAFGLWNFAAKASLALAAILVLPGLEGAGFRPGADNDPAALARLSVLYALVPCALKLVALATLLLTRKPTVVRPC